MFFMTLVKCGFYEFVLLVTAYHEISLEQQHL